MAGGLDYKVVYPSDNAELFNRLFDNARDNSKVLFYAKRVDIIGGISEQFTVTVDTLHFGRPVTFEVHDEKDRRFMVVVPEDDPATFTLYV